MLAKKGHTHVKLRDVYQYALPKFYGLHFFDISAQRYFGIGAAINVMEQHTWQTPLRHIAKTAYRPNHWHSLSDDLLRRLEDTHKVVRHLFASVDWAAERSVGHYERCIFAEVAAEVQALPV